MTKEETLIRGILGPVGCDVRPLVCAVQITGRLLFEEHIPQDDIQVTKHIYPEVAKLTGKSLSAVSRQLVRLANLCWDQLGKEERLLLIGRQIKDIRAPRDMLFYLAYYCRFNMPYYEVLRQNPQLLFGKGELLQEEA